MTYKRARRVLSRRRPVYTKSSQCINGETFIIDGLRDEHSAMLVVRRASRADAVYVGVSVALRHRVLCLPSAKAGLLFLIQL